MQSIIPVRLTSNGNVRVISGSLGYDTSKLANPVPSLGPGAAGCTLHATDGSGGSVGWQITSPTTIPAGSQDILMVAFDIVGGSGLTEVPVQGTPTGFAASDPAGANIGLGANGGLIDLTTGNPQAASISAEATSWTAPVVVPVPVPVIAPAPDLGPIVATIPPGGGPPIITHAPPPLTSPPGPIINPGGTVSPGGTVTPGGTTPGTSAASGDQWIAGIPNIYLIGGVAVAAYFMFSK